MRDACATLQFALTFSCHSELTTRTSHFVNHPDHENQYAPLSYHGAWRIVWLVLLFVIAWFLLRSLQPVVLLFALVFLLAMVLNPIVVWLRKFTILLPFTACPQSRSI
jgi:hypothetical protein